MNYGILNYDYHNDGNLVTLDSVTVCSFPGGDWRTYTGNLDNIIEKILTFGVDCYLVLNGAHFFGFIDYYALGHNLPRYEDIKRELGHNKINCPAWSIREGLGDSYSRKLWIKSNSLKSRHKRLYAASFMNFGAIMGTNDLQEVSAMLGVNYEFNSRHDNSLLSLYQCVSNFNNLFYEITGEYYLRSKGVACWTMGGAAKNYYLKSRYLESYSPLKAYQYSHPQNINYEYALREYKLLPPGLLYINTNTIICNVKKYDKNSLFPAIERQLPELGKLNKCDIEEWNYYPDSRYEYIIIIKSALFELKEGMPPIWHNPFEAYSGVRDNNKYIAISQPWAVFAPYFDQLTRFYSVKDIEIECVLKARKNEDSAIQKYVDTLYPLKAQARVNNNPGLATLIKFFINNLHGKFAQKTVDLSYDYYLDTDTQQILKAPCDLIDEWENKHFDYIRGAYIYSMAAVVMLDDLYELSQRGNIKDHIFYIDTDCIITDLTLPDDWVDTVELGKYKLEATYKKFQALAPKTYFGEENINKNGATAINIVCAGINKNSLYTQIEDYYKSKLSDIGFNNISLLLNSNHLFGVKVLKRGIGGNYYDTVYRHITATDIHEREI